MQRLWAIALPIVIATVLVMPLASYAQKPLATGVLKKIPSNLNPRDSFSLPLPMPGLTAPSYEPKFLSKDQTLEHLGKRVVMFRDVWEYEFSFVGQLRQASMIVPNLKDGTSSRQNVWYLIYRIRDFGKTLTYEQVKHSPEFEHIKHELKRNETLPPEKRFFLPRISLEGWVMPGGSNGYQKVTYSNRVSPMVLRQIQRREDPTLNLLDPIAMSKTKVPLAKTDADGGVWGVAVFQNVDPRIDYVKVFVGGLTNAYRIGHPAGQPNKMKTLQLNFWRPGDIFTEEIDKIDFGIPLVDDPQKQILITQRYNLPGPVLRCYHINRDAADLKVLVAEADGEIDLETLQSRIAPQLDGGQVPTTVTRSFAVSGVDLNAQTAVNTIVPGKRWTFNVGDERYILALEPQYWERKDDESIRFTKSLDHLWIYR